MITVGVAITDINWKIVFSVAFVAAIYSILTSIGGLPEVPAVNTDSEDLVELRVYWTNLKKIVRSRKLLLNICVKQVLQCIIVLLVTVLAKEMY